MSGVARHACCLALTPPDTTSYISQGWQEKAEKTGISADLVKPIPLLEQMVKEGKLGRKSGKGFYDVSRVHTVTSPALTWRSTRSSQDSLHCRRVMH